MTDRELLELAARAAGIEFQWRGSVLCDRHGLALHWNPLTDPGDALRLAVQLNMDITMWTDKVFAAALRQELAVVAEPLGTDPLAATMRAIVRAAAEVGRAK